MLTNSFGFDESEITIMIDTDPAYTKPTGGCVQDCYLSVLGKLSRMSPCRNIKQRLTELVGASQYGDVLVFHFSGHGEYGHGSRLENQRGLTRESPQERT